MTGLLHTDRYEFTMLDSAMHDGTADRQAVFQVFCRRLGGDRRVGVFAGLGRLLDHLADLGPTSDDLEFLGGFVRAETLAWLRRWRFDGDVDAYAEGELHLPWSPVLTVRADLGSAMLLETVVLSVVNHDSAVASAALDIVLAAGDRPVIEMGSRRTHEEAAVAAARAAVLAGFVATSNLEAGRRYGVPTTGTAAHSWTLAHPGVDGEVAAFGTQLDVLGADTTLLVDTHDLAEGIQHSVRAARERDLDGPGRIRIDSGDLAERARFARGLLDELGATATGIVVSGDLDADAIRALADEPIDGYGVGTAVVSGLAPAGFVYKLVAIEDDSGRMVPVAKDSPGKQAVGGDKRGVRALDADGRATAEHVLLGDADAPSPIRELARPVVRAGDRLDHHDVPAAAKRLSSSLDEIGGPAALTSGTGPVIPTIRDRSTS